MTQNEQWQKAQLDLAYGIRQRVVTLDGPALDAECVALAVAIQSGGCRPDCVVGIASAGSIVAAALSAHLSWNPTVLEVTARRPTTAVKQRLHVKRYLRYIPRTLSDELRRLEHRFVTRRLPPQRVVEMADHQLAVLRSLNAQPLEILVVDDCVDTGASLYSVVEYLHTCLGAKASIVTAALTVSVRDPMIRPNFSCHENLQFRGPWSNDV